MPSIITTRIVSLVALLFSIFLISPASLASLPSLQAVHDQQNVSHIIEFLPFSGEARSVDEALSAQQWRPLPQNSRSLGRNVGETWFRLRLSDAQQTPDAPFYLQLDYPHYDYLDAYLMDGTRVTESFFTGDQRDFDSRPVDQRTFMIPMGALSGAAAPEVLIRIDTPGPLLIPFALLTAPEAAVKDRNVAMWLGIYFGILLIMFAYNAFILGALRDSAYLYYLAYMAAVGVHQATLQGLGYQYFWPEGTPISNNYAVALSSALMQGTAVLFVVKFIRLYENFGRFERVVGSVLLVYSWLLVFGSPFMEYSSFLTVVNITGAISVFCGLYIGIQGWRKRVQYARLFALAWFVYLVFIGWYLLELASIIPASTYGEHILAVGSALELALLSIAFADRINHEKELRLRTQSRLMDVQVAMNAELEEKVRLRTQELEEANRRLEVLSTTDGLTGLLNRRRFDELYEKAYLQACRRNEPLAVLMIDIDHFKQLNDEHGHRFGDICLIEAGKLITQTIDDNNAICARYGGEEFVIILPGYCSELAHDKAEALRRAFEGHVVRDEASEKVMTVSIGLTVEQPVDREAWEKLLQAADSLLYTAKRNGRNQVAFLHKNAG